jgi:hypothetical protein
MLDLAMTPAAQARAEIQMLKQNPEWVKRYFDGDLGAAEQLKALQLQEHSYATGAVITGLPPPETQRASEADTLAEMGLPPDVTEHYRSGQPVSASEYQQAVALWNSKKQDPEWRAALARGDHKAKTELALLQTIRSSRIDTSLR